MTNTMSMKNTMTGEVMVLALDLIDPHPHNRKQFDEAKLWDLARSMEEHGQTDEVHVRMKADGRAELVVGERRVRAARLLGWSQIRAKQVMMDDEDAMFLVLEHQLSTVDWPASEKGNAVLAMRELRDDEGKRLYTLREIAERLHVSAPSVRDWVAVARCPVELRMAIDAGTVGAGCATLVMKIGDEDQQRQAASMILRPVGKLEPLTVAECKVLCERHFYRSLRAVEFDRGDESLVPVTRDASGAEYGGACATCKSCSAMSEDWEGGSGRAMMCFRVACFDAKVKAAAVRLKAAAEAKGATVLSAREVREVFDRETGEVMEVSGYRDITDKADPVIEGHTNQARMATWRALIKGRQIGLYFAMNPITGAGVELVKYEEAMALITGGKVGKVKVCTGEASEDAAPVPVEEVKDATWDEERAGSNAKSLARERRRDDARLMEMLESVHETLCAVLRARDAAGVAWLAEWVLPSMLRGDAEALMLKVCGELNAPTMTVLGERSSCYSAVPERLAVVLTGAVCAASVGMGSQWEGWRRFDEVRESLRGVCAMDEAEPVPVPEVGAMSDDALRDELEAVMVRYRPLDKRRMQLKRELVRRGG